MKKWICTVCGYTHYGEDAPENCPRCGASKSEFYQDEKRKGCLFGFLSVMIMLATPLLSIFGCKTPVTVDNSTVSTLDLNRYLGKWYEIARFDHKFERNMMQCTATYVLQDNGTIKVTNQGIKNGKWKTSVGKAKITEIPGLLRVSFFGPFYSDYRVMMLAPDYSYALVGGSNDNYLWILSRTPKLDQSTRSEILHAANARGYKTDNLIWIEHKDN